MEKRFFREARSRRVWYALSYVAALLALASACASGWRPGVWIATAAVVVTFVRLVSE